MRLCSISFNYSFQLEQPGEHGLDSGFAAKELTKNIETAALPQRMAVSLRLTVSRIRMLRLALRGEA
jgi:hypothetical protein